MVGSNITIRALFAPNPIPTPLYIKTNYLAYTMQIRITLFALAFIPDMPCPAKTYYGTLGSIVIMSYLYSLHTANSLEEEGGQREVVLEEEEDQRSLYLSLDGQNKAE